MEGIIWFRAHTITASKYGRIQVGHRLKSSRDTNKKSWDVTSHPTRNGSPRVLMTKHLNFGPSKKFNICLLIIYVFFSFYWINIVVTWIFYKLSFSLSISLSLSLLKFNFLLLLLCKYLIRFRYAQNLNKLTLKNYRFLVSLFCQPFIIIKIYNLKTSILIKKVF